VIDLILTQRESPPGSMVRRFEMRVGRGTRVQSIGRWSLTSRTSCDKFRGISGGGVPVLLSGSLMVASHLWAPVGRLWRVECSSVGHLHTLGRLNASQGHGGSSKWRRVRPRAREVGSHSGPPLLARPSRRCGCWLLLCVASSDRKEVGSTTSGEVFTRQV
jgi:hypothetical protein